MKPRILLSRLWPSPVIARLQHRYEVQVDPDDRPLTRETFIAAMRDFDALCPTVTDRIGAEIAGAAGARVRIIANYGAGTEHIDLEAARTNGLAVTNTPGVLTRATAEIAILLILMAARRAGEGERELRDGAWSGWRPTHLLGTGIEGRVLGLIGFGRIGQETARMARDGLGMRIAYHSRQPNVDPEWKDAVYHGSLESLLAQSDVVSLHCPGGPATRHLINQERLKAMKPSAILINTARGSVVDEEALCSALSSGVIAAAGLDVYEQEPFVYPGLKGLQNAVLLPHLGSATLPTRIAMGMKTADNLDAFFDGALLPDRVA
ncbi:MAG: D-glycerate dehydrogenase [Caulobacterales bacterium]